ncbi:PREDICTED: Fanconi anemia group J protein homolog [Brassica oleracea var. oleracea]|uniref:Fanconi anemia group J protein homolog n=1 Tax=Brassica oleracea var. oleracea TaxID=109376 RepID=UPI0006A6C293|nr:PREDICTED: Fanconi anemia group J protein homolog [Brassica oleracea var. oleracea]
MVSPASLSKSEEKETLNPRNVYHIGGLQVRFPYQPYGTQLAFMSRVISTLDRAQRDGRCHALLESPTGTGKTLSLLCSVLAWQQSYASRFPKGNSAHKRSHFTPDVTRPPSTEPSNVVEVEKPPRVPTIFYASRTHAQITQVIREYRKTAYRVPMAVLGARKRSCTNRRVQGKPNLDEICRCLIKDRNKPKCPEFIGKDDIVAHPSLQQNEVHDIEDLVKIGYAVRGCPYFAAWDMYERAQIVFCPYSYIVDQLIRQEKLEDKLNGAIIIFDEAHNMEDIAREAGSIDLGEETLFKLQSELQLLSLAIPMIYQPVCDAIDGLISWIGSRKDSLAKRDPQHYFSSWTGDKALRELEESNITRKGFRKLSNCLIDAIERSMKEIRPHLSGIFVSTLQELLVTLGYFFSRDGSHSHTLDYELGLQRFIKRGDSSGKWTHTLSLWCMNPSVVFKAIVDLSSSIILTSGTLSPMDSFSSELGMQFGACLEAPHVVDANQQVWAAGIFSGPNNQPLNASYKTNDEYPFQDALGKSLEEICSIVPGGSLVFFPSYKLMEKLCTRWRETGQWSRLRLEKDIFIEPRGGATGEFENVLKGYYDCIGGKNRLIGRNRRAGTRVDSKKGGAFLAVCRGKVSEGLDFSDDNARAVIIVGIPFPNLHDVLVGLKRSYNDTYKSSRNLLGGGEWYCQQAYRALNQAAGRCIRHRFDYGAIIFLDERYRQQRNRVSISKWLRQSIKLYDNFEESMQDLKSFFPSAKEHVESKMLSYKEVIDLECVVQTEPETSFVINGSSASSPFSCSSGLTLERGGPPSVSSHALKRRKFISSAAVIDLEKENNHDIITRRIEFGSDSSTETRARVQISCLLCRSPLGHPDNNGSSYLNCLVTRSSKKYLLSLLKETSRSEMPTSVSVIVTDCSSVDQRLCTKDEGIWCEQDGCVFNTIFCPFCSVPNTTCLGVQIMATDSSNVHFLSKILFFSDHLNVMGDAAIKETLLEHKVT